MQWLWTWGGKCFGYRDGNDLWTYDGRHVGRFFGDEVFHLEGHYLGEIKKNNRLITNTVKKSRRRGGAFARHGNRGTYARVANYADYAMDAGYEDFPNPEVLR